MRLAEGATCTQLPPEINEDHLSALRLEEMLDLPVDLVMQDSAEPLTLASKIAREKGRRL